MAFDIKLMEILACPVCKGKLSINSDKSELLCKFDHVAYPIEHDIPVLLESEARKLTEEERS
ncbi:MULTISPECIES: Trm112 family protein [unclassified Thalassotalea]|uniref:Trm112 family protein n=1 Tax=unclassified Thalassotalea TaxID=2614972 RepID=UPI001080FB7A|nr:MULTISPECIES: Trm112 family protein [unclassified Thalassotalea]NMP16471.1 Trm112 family protein [Thalassotalea sp. Y01]QBY03159.1 Trm112 family protein [Thalassotalea sp. HSM 43]